jgi:hypothetical protein
LNKTILLWCVWNKGLMHNAFNFEKSPNSHKQCSPLLSILNIFTFFPIYVLTRLLNFWNFEKHSLLRKKLTKVLKKSSMKVTKDLAPLRNNIQICHQISKWPLIPLVHFLVVANDSLCYFPSVQPSQNAISKLGPIWNSFYKLLFEQLHISITKMT